MDSQPYSHQAYERNLERKQGPNLGPIWKKDGGWRHAATPLLISECFNLDIDWDPVNEIFRAHLPNKPEDSIEVIQIVGTIVGSEETSDFLKLNVWDGSGTVIVYYDLERYEKVKQRRAEIDKKFNITPEIKATALRTMKQVTCHKHVTQDSDHRRQGFQDNIRAWWESTNEGMFGKHLEVGDYVTVFGFCALKNYNPNEIASWRIDALPIMIFAGVYVDVIDEETYETKLTNFINMGVHKYCETSPSEPAETVDEIVEQKPEVPDSTTGW